MNDISIPLSRLLTIGTWAATLTVLVAAWITFLLGQRWLAQMFGYTSCAMSAVAATCSIRCFSLRTAHLIRLAGRIGPEEKRRPHLAEL